MPALLDWTCPTVAEDLALDEALLVALDEAGRRGEDPREREVLRLWEARAPAVVMGVTGRRAREARLEACEAAGIPVLRRISGGGTVLLGPGCLCYSLVLSFEGDRRLRDLRGSYVLILERVIGALADLLPGLSQAGTSDLAALGLKVSGNAQRRAKHGLLHHGTLLYDADIAAISAYLAHPPRMPEYRQDRSHAEFLRQIPASRAELSARLAAAWGATTPLAAVPDIGPLMEQRYGQSEWHARK